MKKKINQQRKLRKEISTRGPSLDGAPSFRGGPFGFGHKNQMAAPLNPATQAIEDQTQAEINQNAQDQRYLNRSQKNGLLPAVEFQDIHGNPDLETDFDSAEDLMPLPEEKLEERSVADSFYTHLPGTPWRDNALEYPIDHVPGVGEPTGDEEYLIDDIIDELEEKERVYESFIKEFGVGGGASGAANFTYSGKSSLGDSLPNNFDDEEEDMSYLTVPSVERTPVGTMGNVLFPRQFVPKEMVQQSYLEDEDMDGISDNIDLDQPDVLTQRIKAESLDSFLKSLLSDID